MRECLAILILALVVLGCSTSRTSTSKNYAGIYNSDATHIQPSFKLFHSSIDTSTLYFELQSTDLIYSRKTPTSDYTASFTIRYELFNDFSDRFIVDSLTSKVIDINPNKKSKRIFGRIKFPFQLGRKCVMNIKTSDLERKEEHVKVLSVDKKDVGNEQFFLWKSEDVLLNNYINTKEIQIKNNLGGKITKLLQYNVSFPIARPPFAQATNTRFDNSPDKTTTVENQNDVTVVMPDTGFVYVKSDTAKNGFALFRFSDDFPTITSGTGLLEPLRYICSSDEYKDLLKAENPKKAVEEFWLKKCKSKDRARVLIKEFYNRVNNANKFFSSYLEGWKTDRGMVSIIYGKPMSILKRKSFETWTYGEQNTMNSISFSFEIVENPFSNNDFRLLRNVNFKTGWYRALEFWRSGRVYTAGK